MIVITIHTCILMRFVAASSIGQPRLRDVVIKLVAKDGAKLKPAVYDYNCPGVGHGVYHN